MKRSTLSFFMALMVLLPLSSAWSQDNVDDTALRELREAMQRLDAGSTVTNKVGSPAVQTPKADSREESLRRLREALASLDESGSVQTSSNAVPSDIPMIDPETVRRLQESMKKSESPASVDLDLNAAPTAAALPVVAKTPPPTVAVPKPVVVQPEAVTVGSQKDAEIDQRFRRNAANDVGERGTGLSEATIRNNEIHKLSPGDKLSYMVLEDPDADDYGEKEVIVKVLKVAEFPVSMNPEFKSDFIEISTANRTIAAVENELKEKLERFYYEKATVRLKLAEGTSTLGHVIFTGFAQGVIPLNSGVDKTLVECINSLGGFQREWADMRHIIVTRTDPKTGQLVKQEYNYDEISRDQRLDPVMKDGDYVDIQERTFKIFN